MTTGAGGDGGGAAGAGAPGAPGTGGSGAPGAPAAPAAPAAPPAANHGHHEPDPFYEMMSGEDVIEGRKLTPLKAFQQRNRERIKAAVGKVYERASMFVQRVVPTSQQVDWRDNTPFAKRIETIQRHRDASYHSGDSAQFTRRGELLDEAEHRARERQQIQPTPIAVWTREQQDREREARIKNSIKDQNDLKAGERYGGGRQRQFFESEKRQMQHRNDNGNEMI